MLRILLIGLLLGTIMSAVLLVRERLRAGRAPPRDPVAARFPVAGALLFVLPLPVLAAAIIAMARGLLTPLLGNSLGYLLYLVGAWFILRGLMNETLLAQHPNARRLWPLKTIGSGLIGLATGITAWLGVGHHPVISLTFGLVALLGCLLFYGRDPRRREGDHPDFRRAPPGSAHATLSQAEQTIAAIEHASRAFRSSELRDRLQRITRLARDILRLLEDDPRNLYRARTFLNVYLDGVERVVQGYARTHQWATSPDLDANFRRVLVSIEAAFEEQRAKLLEKDLLDLDVAIEVLTSQLKREGLM
ncbi:hypothetical protein CKO25_07475 [Thiocapsa imhoffii]|uniref:5-bromo-4-chloroindolyl phosphate hydrolysis protein n=1 Tax=Thiocapsa imhoffii TaxID=382777 RepID=A0A9X1B8Y7_9GAMM|nr:5-bromo-4-chloroindolyl phosphate hydrolysis family protein [Thiocapsa imhoffii]MBK1644496.1 hypothetical protein [Thiocapsa imhoffii]